MRPLRYGINVTLDGCCDHRVMVPDQDLHRFWAESLARACRLGEWVATRRGATPPYDGSTP